MCRNVQKNIYKVYTMILCHGSNINTLSPLLSNHIKLEKQEPRNLSFLQHCCFAGWQVWGLQTCQPPRHPTRPVSWMQALIFAVPSGTHTRYELWQWYVRNIWKPTAPFPPKIWTCNTVIFKKLIAAQLLRKFPFIYKTCIYITIFTTAGQWNTTYL